MKSELNILIFLIFLSSFSFGQNRKLTDEEIKNSTAAKINFSNPETCVEIDEWIKSDIKNLTIFLFLQGGISPVEYTTDKNFENKYGIYFFDFGCISAPEKCTIEYNTRVFDYLTRKFGKEWMNKIRKDVIGFKEWKKNYKQNK